MHREHATLRAEAIADTERMRAETVADTERMRAEAIADVERARERLLRFTSEISNVASELQTTLTPSRIT